MYLSILAILMAPFIGSLVKSGMLLNEVYHLEKTQIVLDNAGILIGRSDREIFRYIVRANRILKKVETIHHYWHACAKNPKTAQFCKPKDVMIETWLLKFSSNIKKTMAFMWLQSLRNGLNYIAQHNVKLKKISRPNVPIMFLPCEICGLPIKIVLDRQKLLEPTYLLSQGNSKLHVLIYNLGESLDVDHWNYKLGDTRCEK